MAMAPLVPKLTSFRASPPSPQETGTLFPSGSGRGSEAQRPVSPVASRDCLPQPLDESEQCRQGRKWSDGGEKRGERGTLGSRVGRMEEPFRVQGSAAPGLNTQRFTG